MSEFNYSQSAATASRLLRRFGVEVVLKPRAQGVFNRATGKVEYGALGAEFSGEIDVMAVLDDYAQRDIDGTLIQVGDRRIYLDATKLPLNPKTGDVLLVPVMEGKDVVAMEEYEVIQSKTIAPGGFVVLHDIQARKD